MIDYEKQMTEYEKQLREMYETVGIGDIANLILKVMQAENETSVGDSIDEGARLAVTEATQEYIKRLDDITIEWFGE